MPKQRMPGLRRLIAGGVLLGGLTIVQPVLADEPPCANGGGDCPRVIPGSIPAPNGAFLSAWMSRQVDKAQADNFVVYQHEWYRGGTELGPYGYYHLREMAKRLRHVPFAVVIQPDIHANVNEARRLVLVNALTNAGYTDAAQRVIVDFPQAEGLYGESAPLLYRRFILGGGQGLGQTGGFGGTQGSGFGSTLGSLGGLR